MKKLVLILSLSICRLSGLGIINGNSETSLVPNDYLTREEAAAGAIDTNTSISIIGAEVFCSDYF